MREQCAARMHAARACTFLRVGTLYGCGAASASVSTQSGAGGGAREASAALPPRGATIQQGGCFQKR
eukprot:4471052-Alexandrium_andersonii.AAC.1